MCFISEKVLFGGGSPLRGNLRRNLQISHLLFPLRRIPPQKNLKMSSLRLLMFLKQNFMLNPNLHSNLSYLMCKIASEGLRHPTTFHFFEKFYTLWLKKVVNMEENTLCWQKSDSRFGFSIKFWLRNTNNLKMRNFKTVPN